MNFKSRWHSLILRTISAFPGRISSAWLNASIASVYSELSCSFSPRRFHKSKLRGLDFTAALSRSISMARSLSPDTCITWESLRIIRLFNVDGETDTLPRPFDAPLKKHLIYGRFDPRSQIGRVKAELESTCLFLSGMVIQYCARSM
jgi:hypothetical protein